MDPKPCHSVRPAYKAHAKSRRPGPIDAIKGGISVGEERQRAATRRQVLGALRRLKPEKPKPYGLEETMAGLYCLLCPRTPFGGREPPLVCSLMGRSEEGHSPLFTCNGMSFSYSSL